MSIRLAIGLPAYRGVIASSHAKMWMQTGAELLRHKPLVQLMMIANVDVCGIDRARNTLLAHAMKEGADWLLMIDSDTWVDPGSDLVRMIVEAPMDAALVGAAVRTRGLGRGEAAPLNVYVWNEEAKAHQAADIAPDNVSTYIDVDALGGAVIAINLHRIGDTIFRWHYYNDNRSISEDLYFCRQLRLRGEQIYVDTRIKTFHVDKPAVLGNESR